jgi:hypothetical protein
MNNVVDTVAVFQHFESSTLKHTSRIAIVLEEFVVLWLFFRKATSSSLDWDLMH